MADLLERLQSDLAARYRIEGEVAEGGMAIVFRATDLKHDRKVAVKVLRPELSAMVGADRFLREIRVTARLQHPHILPLYDSGAAAELLYYVMPLINGESLRERLRRERQLPVNEVVSVIGAIASALDYAHRQGVLHRDIKPENILLHDRQPLLADFGIALAVSAAGGDRLTVAGLAIGTPSYMSPEQIAGEQTLDARTDIYALGCVAYEMLTGDPPFTGPNLQAVMASVMTGTPRPVEETRRTVPAGVAAAIHRAMERLPADRFHSAADFAAALTADSVARRPRRRSSWRDPGVVAIGAIAGVIIGLVAARFLAPVAHPSVRRLSIVLPDSSPAALAGAGSTSERQTSIALSPAGDRLAYVASHGNTTVLAMRRLDSDSVTLLSGTEGAYYPFFSPDGAWIGFFTGNTLRKVPSAGGSPVTVVAVDRITGANWVSADRILVFENEGFDLHWVSASGATADTTIHLTTQFGTADILEGGEWAVGQLSSGQLALLSLRNGLELAITRRGVLPMDSVRQADLLFGASPRWLSPSHLVYGAGDGVLMAMPFDGSKRRVLGEAVPLLTGVQMEAGFGYAEFALSRDGTLVYIPGHNQLYVNIAFVSTNGKIDTLPFPRGQYTQPRLSPDGTQLAVQARNPLSGWELLLMNLATGLRRQVEVQGNYRPFPGSWLPSGRALLIGLWNPVQFLNYGARIQSLEDGRYTDIHLPGASYMTVSPDGRSFVFSDWRTGELFIRSLGADTARIRIPARGFAASFSPDGRWLAWGGVNGAVAVSPVPPTGAIYPVAERGEMPLWTPNGEGLIYRDRSRYFMVPIATTGGFRAGRPRLLVEGPFVSTFAWNHDIARDGRLLVLLSSPEKTAASLGVITGFSSAVDRASPTQPPAH
jgi:serine/threonine protein kinase/Tol biopolymer transport system component